MNAREVLYRPVVDGPAPTLVRVARALKYHVPLIAGAETHAAAVSAHPWTVTFGDV